jgi:prepilin-type N-terminal cleavage/methylation domain-containing protein
MRSEVHGFSPLAFGSLRGTRGERAWAQRGGFTLLEVLAAVAILGIAYIALGSSGIQALQHEGESRRRLQASLLADSELAEIETQLEAGLAPQLGKNEREAEGFQVAVEVTPFTIDIPEENTASGQRLGKARSRLGGSDAQRLPQPVIPGPSLLGGGQGAGAVSPLRKIDVRVTWNEGFGERSVARTTFGLDREAAAPTIDALNAQTAAQSQQKKPGAPAANPLNGGKSGPIGTQQ